MSEELLKAIIQLFAIVARERVTEDERANIKEFLSVHLNQEASGYYLQLFDNYCHENTIEDKKDLEVDDDTLMFVEDWSKIMAIIKQVNLALTAQQKVVLVMKIIELVYADRVISERQENLIFYIGEALKITRSDTIALKSFVIGEDLEELSSKNILIIDEGSGEYKIKGPRIVAKNLTGLVAIFRVPHIETYFIKYLGISTLYVNSITLKSRKIDIFPTGSTIKGDKIDTIYYSDVVTRFLRGKSRSKITFTAEHLFYHFKSGRAGLQNVNLSAEGGKLIGIMGASGSGKSTLLNVINGMDKPSGGRVIINGINIHENPEKVKGVVGYIPQDDLLMEDLSVFQNLYYAARLCFSYHSKAETSALVNKVLLNLGLSEIAHLKVGSPLDKTISGGQRKRVNIGLELLREPSVLFVDEPTSGLSSQDSENIMDLLKELSLRGKMVFVVIHQPSSDIFKMFDDLLILDVGGFEIYYGNPIEAITYFKEIVNAANRKQSTCPECGNINPEQIFSIIETKVVNEFGRLTNTRKVSPGQWYQYFKDHKQPRKIVHETEKIKVSQKIPNKLKQLKVFIKRDLLSKLSDRQYLLINLIQAPLLALFMTFLVRYYATIERDNPTYSFFENDNIPVYFFMSIIVALFMGLTVSAEEIFRDRKILKRERFLDLSKGSYLTSKIFVLFMLSAIQTCSFVIVGNYVLELRDMDLSFWMILFSCSCFSNIMGLNISSAFNSAVTIYILIPLLLIPQLLLSGVVINFDKFNPAVSSMDGVPAVGEVMASRWAFEAALVTQFKDNPYERQFYKFDKRLADAEYKKLYYVPRLESELSNAFVNLKYRLNPQQAPKIIKSLEILSNEISSELASIGSDKFEYLDRLKIDKFDSLTHKATSQFLLNLGQYYINKYKKAEEEKEAYIATLTDTPRHREQLDSMMYEYQNEAIVTALTNKTATYRVIEIDNRLVRKINPIYFTDEQPSGPFDFRAKFFVPVKHFLGFKIDTLYFNVMMIWFMSFLLFITLYFDGLKRLIAIFTYRKKRVGPQF
ncbi:MAG TPA: ATP-binding cassette domain-containing protein [Fulvivirga sp.]|nr:ATP-binding cassette domain-containing protein [Fulvivirga sp.]